MRNTLSNVFVFTFHSSIFTSCLDLVCSASLLVNMLQIVGSRKQIFNGLSGCVIGQRMRDLAQFHGRQILFGRNGTTRSQALFNIQALSDGLERFGERRAEHGRSRATSVRKQQSLLVEQVVVGFGRNQRCQRSVE